METGGQFSAGQVDVVHGGREIAVAGVLGDLVDGPIGAGQVGQPQVPEGVGGQPGSPGASGDAFTVFDQLERPSGAP